MEVFNADSDRDATRYEVDLKTHEFIEREIGKYRAEAAASHRELLEVLKREAEAKLEHAREKLAFDERLRTMERDHEDALKRAAEKKWWQW
jgi:hypothetical protein